LFQYDVNVIWDLAVHDLSIMDFVLEARPSAVSATGISHVPNTPQDVAYMTLYFDFPLIVHINVNWLSPVKVRQTLIGGSKKMIVFNDLEPSEKIKVYDTGITVNNSLENTYEIMVGYRTGDMWAPKCDNTEALQVECRHFLDCINNNKTPTTDGQVGLRVVKIMEAANESMARQGQPVKLTG
jgi:predicted dehydrogenase